MDNVRGLVGFSNLFPHISVDPFRLSDSMPQNLILTTMASMAPAVVPINPARNKVL